MMDPARDAWALPKPPSAEQIVARAEFWAEHQRRNGLIKEVVCELCQRGNHLNCVMPCTCAHRVSRRTLEER